MQSIIAGNGITIQFGGNDYLNEKIIKRAINNINTNNFPAEIYPREIKKWLLLLHSIIPDILEGKYDKYTYMEELKRSLVVFKKKYNHINKKTKVHKFGFEDYFLVHFLFCHKNRITNPERYNFTESLRCLFLDSIYNHGKVQNIYVNYPLRFVDFLKNFDNIFTTNYDWNLEKVVDKEVQYLHGAFHHLSEVYDVESFRNRMPDSPIKSATMVKGCEHLYSDALTSYSGENKRFSLDMGINANIAVENFVNESEQNPDLWHEIESWEDDASPAVRNLFHSIMLKKHDKSLRFKENTSLNNISNLQGIVVIVGLSPDNDNHIFDFIRNNINISKVVFYYYDECQVALLKEILPDKNLIFKNVIDLWKSFY